MRDSENLGALRMISRMQAARVETARITLKAADKVLHSAGERTREGEVRRDTALGEWRDSLADIRPDPAHITRAGDWLVRHEAGLKAAQLDETIAQGRRDDSASELAEKTALHEVARQLSGRLERQVARAREERRLHAADDFFRMRRFSCLPL